MYRATGSALVVLSIAVLAACSSGASTSPAASPSPLSAPSVAASASASGPAASSPAASSPAASGPTTVAMGSFHRVDADASGTVALEHLADGSFAVVFEEFTVATAEHTNVILVSNTDVTTDADIDQTKIVGLTIDAERLSEIRQVRARLMRLSKGAYSELVEIYAELEQAEAVHRRLGCPVVDVSELSIEETAQRVLRIVERRKAGAMAS